MPAIMQCAGVLISGVLVAVKLDNKAQSFPLLQYYDKKALKSTKRAFYIVIHTLFARCLLNDLFKFSVYRSI